MTAAGPCCSWSGVIRRLRREVFVDETLSRGGVPVELIFDDSLFCEHSSLAASITQLRHVNDSARIARCYQDASPY